MKFRAFRLGAMVALLAGLAIWLSTRGEPAPGQGHKPRPGGRSSSLTDHGIPWPTREKVWRTISLADYNTRVVFAGVTALGAAGGLVGTFLLLRKRSLLSDTVSHCTLPGIALAFLAAEALGWSGRSLPLLLAGATIDQCAGHGHGGRDSSHQPGQR